MISREWAGVSAPFPFTMFAVCLPKCWRAVCVLADAQEDRVLWRKYRLELWPLCVGIMRGGFLYACARDCGRIRARRCGRLAGIVCRMFASPQKNFCTFLKKSLQVSNIRCIFAYEIKQQTKMKTNIYIEGIAKESEKAVCLHCLVSYNDNKAKARDIWFPKSVCNVVSEHLAEVENWFIAKTSEANAFNGYRMNFETYMA